MWNLCQNATLNLGEGEAENEILQCAIHIEFLLLRRNMIFFTLAAALDSDILKQRSRCFSSENQLMVCISFVLYFQNPIGPVCCVPPLLSLKHDDVLSRLHSMLHPMQLPNS